jgi:hypothetical protein
LNQIRIYASQFILIAPAGPVLRFPVERSRPELPDVKATHKPFTMSHPKLKSLKNML